MTFKIASLSAILLFSIAQAFAAKQYSLDQLIEHPDFEVEILANGDYSEGSVELKIKSSHNRDVELIIPAGTEFYTSDEHDQILIIVEDQVIALYRKRFRKKVLDGYCTEASDGVPGTGMAFQFMPTKREKLQKLADFINENGGFDSHAIQEAVWCVSDNHSLSYISSDNPAKTKKLTQFVADLTEQEIPWHHVRRNLGQSDGYVLASPVFVSGEIEFATDKPTTVKCKILTAEGELIYDNPDTLSVPKTHRAKLNFKVSVSGWDTGTYFVVYYNQDDEVLLKKEFII
ncbi:MAG: hypothetical protein GYB31_09635 [Bacteroidetes bacterium]|nr:hypothetical protein [Bacteroidota bacterium]